MKPIKVHVHIFGSVLYKCISDDTIGDTVVKLNFFGTLDMDHFMQVIVKGHGIFSVDKN